MGELDTDRRHATRSPSVVDMTWHRACPPVTLPLREAATASLQRQLQQQLHLPQGDWVLQQQLNYKYGLLNEAGSLLNF